MRLQLPLLETVWISVRILSVVEPWFTEVISMPTVGLPPSGLGAGSGSGSLPLPLGELSALDVGSMEFSLIVSPVAFSWDAVSVAAGLVTREYA